VDDELPKYSLTIIEFPEYLEARVKAETISEEIIAAYVREIADASNASGKGRILLYRDIPMVLSGGSVFHTVAASLELLRGKKIALVNPYAEIDAEIGFGMTVGQNRGGDYANFRTVEDAKAWLLK